MHALDLLDRHIPAFQNFQDIMDGGQRVAQFMREHGQEVVFTTVGVAQCLLQQRYAHRVGGLTRADVDQTQFVRREFMRFTKMRR
jgi:hypothetical protein